MKQSLWVLDLTLTWLLGLLLWCSSDWLALSPCCSEHQTHVDLVLRQLDIPILARGNWDPSLVCQMELVCSCWSRTACLEPLRDSLSFATWSKSAGLIGPSVHCLGLIRGSTASYISAFIQPQLQPCRTRLDFIALFRTSYYLHSPFIYFNWLLSSCKWPTSLIYDLIYCTLAN